MTTLNEETKHTDEQKNHTSWLNSILNNVQDLDYDFPLSGGEHEHVIYKHYALKTKEDIVQPPTENDEEPKENSSWFNHILARIQDMDTDFPLSGGEHN